MACVAEAQAVTTVSHGPWKPNRIEIAAAPALAIIIGTRKGETRPGPFLSHTRTCSTRVWNPPTPLA